VRSKLLPEIATENGLAALGEEIEMPVISECVQSVPVIATREYPRRSTVSYAAS
jgi:hypothetical protein